MPASLASGQAAPVAFKPTAARAQGGPDPTTTVKAGIHGVLTGFTRPGHDTLTLRFEREGAQLVMRGDLDDASAGRLRDALDRQAQLLGLIGQLVDLRVDLPATDRNVDKPEN